MGQWGGRGADQGHCPGRCNGTQLVSPWLWSCPWWEDTQGTAPACCPWSSPPLRSSLSLTAGFLPI